MPSDLSDCGWRSQPRTVPQGVARSNDCYLNGPLKDISTSVCIDLNDHWAISQEEAQAVLDIAGYWNADGNPTTDDVPNLFNGWYSIQQCGLGTQVRLNSTILTAFQPLLCYYSFPDLSVHVIFTT